MKFNKSCQFALFVLFAAGLPIAPASACCMGGSPVSGAVPKVNMPTPTPNIPKPNIPKPGGIDGAVNSVQGGGGDGGVNGRLPPDTNNFPDPNNFKQLDPSTQNAIQTALNAGPDPAEVNKANLRNAVDAAQAGYDAAIAALQAEQDFRTRVANTRFRNDWGTLTPEEIDRVKRLGGSMDDNTAWNNFMNDQSRINNLVQNVDNASKAYDTAKAAALAGHAWD